MSSDEALEVGEAGAAEAGRVPAASLGALGRVVRHWHRPPGR